MAKPKKPQAGMDYARLTTTLATSKVQSTNNELHQTIQGLIDGARQFEGFLEGRYNDLNANLSRLFLSVDLILAELTERDSTKYSVSVSNSDTQSLPDSTIQTCSYNITVYDDGLMFDGTDTLQINANAQWLICGRILFPSGTGIRRVAIYLNGKRQFSTEFASLDTEVIMPYVGIIEALEGDLVTVSAYQESGGALDIIPSLQMTRLTFVNRGSGRNLIENDNGTGTGGGGGGGTGGCNNATVPPPQGPTFYTDILAAHSAPNCWNVDTLAAAESDFNALNYWYQRDSSGNIRGRLFYPTPTSYGQYVDTNRPDGGWGWFQHGF